ncbi:DnaB-like helicase C-terminal domain-containing protein [Shigella boydii]
MVALSQLNRSLEQRADNALSTPTYVNQGLSSRMRTITFIYRDEVYHENSDLKGIAEIIIGKQRNGPMDDT